MRIILPFVMLWMLPIGTLLAQVINYGAEITNKEKVYILGDYTAEDNGQGAQGVILNQKEIYLRGHLVNLSKGSVFVRELVRDGQASDTVKDYSLVVLEGDQLQEIGGDSTVQFYQLRIDKSEEEVLLTGRIAVGDSLTMVQQPINLNDQELYFEYVPYNQLFGSLWGECEDARVYDDALGVGKLRIQFAGVPNDVLFDDNIGLDIQSDENFSGLLIERYHNVEQGVGDGSIQRIFFVTSDESYKRVQGIGYDYFDGEYDAGDKDENKFGPWVHYSDDQPWWSVWNADADTRDTGLNTIQSFKDSVLQPFQKFAITETDCATPPPVTLGHDTLYYCSGDSVTIGPENLDGLYYVWSTGDSTQHIQVGAAGSYSLHVWTSRGCYNADTVLVLESPRPEALPHIPHGGFVCDGGSMAFENYTDTLSGVDYTDIQYRWDFGDPNNPQASSYEKAPTYTYQTYGQYAVTLVATTRYGCADTATISATVNEVPKAMFTVGNTCAGIPLDIVEQTAFESSQYVVSSLWTLRQGSTEIAQYSGEDPAFILSDYGTYALTLVADANNGCSDTLSTSLSVYPLPEPAFTFRDSICVGSDVAISNMTAIDSGQVFYQWTFGDGTTSRQETPMKAYTAGGTYRITLAASSGAGCSVTDSASIHIVDMETPDFTTVNACSGAPIQLDVTAPLGSGYTYEWSLDESSTYSGNPLPWTFTSFGTHEVALRVTNAAGCSKVVYQTLEAYPVPHTDFDFSDACSGADIHLQNLTTVSYGDLTYSWTFGDQTLSYAQNPLKQYEEAGIYRLLLRATTEHGCTSADSADIQIYGAPETDLGGTIETCGDALTLDAGTAGATYLWSDNSTDAIHTFTASGNYWVEVTSAQNCVTHDDIRVILNHNLEPDLGVPHTYCGAATLDAGYPGSSYLWSDGSTDRYLTTHQSGTYAVTITDQNHCTGYATIDVEVAPLPEVDLGTDDPICTNTTITLDAQNAGSTYHWNTGATSRTIEVAQSGLYSVDVTNAQGCEASGYRYVTLLPQPSLTLAEHYEACDAIMLDAGAGYNQYLWSDGATTRYHEISESGSYTISVASSAQCTASQALQVTLYDSPVLELGPAIARCDGEVVYIDPYTEGEDLQYTWSTGAQQSGILVQESELVWLEVRTPEQCTAYDEVQVYFSAPLDIDLPEEKKLCAGQDLTLEAGTGADAYTWYYNGVVVDEASDHSSLVLSKAGWYKVVAENDLGCRSADSVHVYATTNFIAANFLTASIADIGDSIKFVQLTNPAPTWYQWDFGNGSRSYAYHPAYVYYEAGEYDVSLSVSNDVCRDSIAKHLTIRPLMEEGVGQEEAASDALFTDIVSFSVYPNPTEEQFTIDLELNQPASVLLILYDLNGRVIGRYSKYEVASWQMDLDLGTYRNGIYILHVLVNGEIPINRKVVKW